MAIYTLQKLRQQNARKYWISKNIRHENKQLTINIKQAVNRVTTSKMVGIPKHLQQKQMTAVNC